MMYFLNRITNREILIYNTHLFNIFKNLKFTNDVCATGAFATQIFCSYWKLLKTPVLPLTSYNVHQVLRPVCKLF